MKKMRLIDSVMPQKLKRNRSQFNDRQWDIIQLGIHHKLDVEAFAKPVYDEWKMFRIFEALKGGFKEIVHYADDYDAGQLTQIYRVHKNGYPFGLILDHGYSFSEMYNRINEYERRFIR